MIDARYRGETWQHSLLRASLEAVAAERAREAEAERARLSRQRPAIHAVRPVAAPEPPLSNTNPARPAPARQSSRSPRRYAWHGGANPHDFRMTATTESDPR